MSVANLLPVKQPTNKKPVLQQSNYNFDVTTPEKDDTYKDYLVKNRRDATAQEAENQFSPKTRTSESKTVRSDVTKKMKNMHLELSSLKKSGLAGHKADSLMHKTETEFSSDESGEEETKKKRKVRPVVPNYVTNSDSGPCRKPRQSRQDPGVVSSQNSARLPKTQPLSIARRNARERNRVKQVNEGFATLRNRIPDYISEAYNEEKGRKSAKKLSKVETLRMAVDYIRHLETLLDVRSAENDTWLKEVKGESQQPWSTPKSFADYPSSVESKFQNSSPPPVGYYDQNFEYQERIFYDYDLDFLEKKDNFLADGKSGQQNVETQCVDNFKFYESFDRLKRGENSENGDEDETRLDEDSRESENLNVSEPETEIERLRSPKSKKLVNEIPKKTVLPPVNHSFNKTIPVFY